MGISETQSFIYFFLACKRRFQKMSKESIEKYQLRKAQQNVQYIVKNSVFFKQFYSGYNLDNVWELPIVNKNIMMENLSEYNTVGFKKEDLVDFCLEIEKSKNYEKRFHGYNVAMSSGTSGNKGIVITSPAEEKYLRAAFFARFRFPRVLKLNLAFILRVTTPAFQIDKFGQKLTHINQSNTLEEIRRQLEHLQPNVLSSPPSLLRILAKEKNKGNLNIQPLRIVSYAEILYPEVKEEIEESFGTKVHQIYQASEGSIAMTCKYGSLHINEDLIYVQTLNEDGSITEPGNPCHKMIVTDLNRKAQPIIRYELNDIITIDTERCQCGSSFRVISQIMGRSDDLFWSKRLEDNELHFIFPDYIRRAIITSSEDISEYQAVQKSLKEIIVRIIPVRNDVDFEQLSEKIRKNIKDIFNQNSCYLPEVKILYEDLVVNPNSQKLIRIFRDFELDI